MLHEYPLLKLIVQNGFAGCKRTYSNQPSLPEFNLGFDISRSNQGLPDYYE